MENLGQLSPISFLEEVKTLNKFGKMEELPRDVIFSIFTYLDEKSLKDLKQTNRSFYYLIHKELINLISEFEVKINELKNKIEGNKELSNELDILIDEIHEKKSKRFITQLNFFKFSNKEKLINILSKLSITEIEKLKIDSLFSKFPIFKNLELEIYLKKEASPERDQKIKPYIDLFREEGQLNKAIQLIQYISDKNLIKSLFFENEGALSEDGLLTPFFKKLEDVGEKWMSLEDIPGAQTPMKMKEFIKKEEIVEILEVAKLLASPKIIKDKTLRTNIIQTILSPLIELAQILEMKKEVKEMNQIMENFQ